MYYSCLAKLLNADGAEITDSTHIGNMNMLRYRGYIYDTLSGLYYLNARFYDPETGRFISMDDISYADVSTYNGLNLYAYCRNNPISYIDPTGHKWWHWVIGTVVVASAVLLVGVAASTIATIVGVSTTVATTITTSATIAAGIAGTTALLTEYAEENEAPDVVELVTKTITAGTVAAVTSGTGMVLSKGMQTVVTTGTALSGYALSNLINGEDLSWKDAGVAVTGGLLSGLTSNFDQIQSFPISVGTEILGIIWGNLKKCYKKFIK